jgi:hypothetical protein
MRANRKAFAGRKGAAVNARATRRLDGKPRPASSPLFACMERAGEVVLGCRYEQQQHTRTTNQFVNARRAYRTRQVMTLLQKPGLCTSLGLCLFQFSTASEQCG